MTTLVHIHQPVPPFRRVAGPFTASNVSRHVGLDVESVADFDLAVADIPYIYLQSGMCFSVDQSDIGEPLWAGFLIPAELPMDAESVAIHLLGPKKALLDIEFAVGISGRLTPAGAIRAALESAQARIGGIYPGYIEDIEPARVVDARGESITDFIDTVRENALGHWQERVVEKDGGLEFYIDYGLLERQTSLVLGRHEIVDGNLEFGQVPSSLTMLGEASGFSLRQAVTSSSGIGSQALEPISGTRIAVDARVLETVQRRAIGPAALAHEVRISERIGRDLSSVVTDKHLELIKNIDTVTCTLDATTLGGRSAQVGDIVRIDVPDWYPEFRFLGDVHIRDMTPRGEAGQRDMIGKVVQ